MEYDPENNGLKTISLHQFEDDELTVGEGYCLYVYMPCSSDSMYECFMVNIL